MLMDSVAVLGPRTGASREVRDFLDRYESAAAPSQPSPSGV